MTTPNPPSPNEALREALMTTTEAALRDALKTFPPETTDVQSRYVIVHQLRASADIQDRQTKRETGWADTSDRAELMRKAANVIEALLSQPSPASSTAGEVREDRVLLLASYCGGDTEGCTDERPCDDCLAMCNVCITHGTIDPIGGLDYLRDYPGVETNHRAIRAAQALSPSSGEPESELFGHDDNGRPQYRFKGAGDVLAAALAGEPASVAVEAVSGEVVDQLKLVNSWLCGLAELDMDEIVADGGITVAMVVQQEAEHQHKRLRSAIAALIANPFDGWQMVPVEITDAMLSATCCDECDDREMRQTWKELLYAAPKPPVSLSKPTPVEAKPWYETDAHRDLSRIIPDMEGKIADAKTRYAHCLPDHLFAPLEASITELRVLRHEVAAQPTPVEAEQVQKLHRLPVEAGLREALDAPLGEKVCMDCHGHNPVWFAPNEVWNFVIGGLEAKGDPGGFFCPNCFIVRAEKAGVIPSAWKLEMETIIE